MQLAQFGTLEEVCNRDRSEQFAVTVEIPIEAVGIDQVGQRSLVAFLLGLVGVLHATDRDVQVFGLQMADREGRHNCLSFFVGDLH